MAFLPLKLSRNSFNAFSALEYVPIPLRASWFFSKPSKLIQKVSKFCLFNCSIYSFVNNKPLDTTDTASCLFFPYSNISNKSGLVRGSPPPKHMKNVPNSLIWSKRLYISFVFNSFSRQIPDSVKHCLHLRLHFFVIFIEIFNGELNWLVLLWSISIKFPCNLFLIFSVSSEL